MGFSSNFKNEFETKKRKNAAEINGKNLKDVLKKLKEEKDRIENETGLDLKLMIQHKCLCRKF